MLFVYVSPQKCSEVVVKLPINNLLVFMLYICLSHGFFSLDIYKSGITRLRTPVVQNVPATEVQHWTLRRADDDISR